MTRTRKTRNQRSEAASPSKAGSNVDAPSIGDRIRFIRKQRGMTLDQLAETASLTKSYLSKIEHGISVSSIATALKVAGSFEMSVGQLLGEERGDESLCVVRRSERKPFMREGSASGYNYEMVAAPKRFKIMEPFIMRPPFEFEIDQFFEHVGEEFIFVLSGTIQFELPNWQVVLKAGDAIYFDSHLPHRSRSLGKNLAETLVMVAK